MYGCCNLRRFLKLLCLDAFVICLLAVLFTAVRTVCADKSEEKPVFLPAIMYHSVFTDTPEEYAVTPVQLENDLKWLYDNDYNSVTAQQLCDYVYNGGTLPENPVLITLDDGYYNNLSVLLPLLEKYDMHAIVSVVGIYTDVNAPADPHVPEYSYLTWEDINVLLSSGRIEIGNHTYNMHSLYKGRKGCMKKDSETESDYADALRSDISLLQDKIMENTGTLPFVFTYPFGAFSRESLPVIYDSGFLITLTCREAPNYITREPVCLYGIGRYNRSGLYSTEYFMNMVMDN